MQFSILRIMLVTAFVSFVLAAVFGLPTPVGFLVLTFVSLFVLPPFIVVGVVNTRGLRQSFFLGAMISGIPHFLITAYFGCWIAILIVSGEGYASLANDGLVDEVGMPIVHAAGFLVGTLGGLSGMASYAFLKVGNRNRSAQASTSIPTQKDDSSPTPPTIYPREKCPNDENAHVNDEDAAISRPPR